MLDDGVYSVEQYIECRSSLADRILAIDALILAMELKTLDATESAVYDEYTMADGQMTVKTKYRTIKDVLAGINALDQLKQRYVNRLNGRIGVMRGGMF